jgi:hypothetical protein
MLDPRHVEKECVGTVTDSVRGVGVPGTNAVPPFVDASFMGGLLPVFNLLVRQASWDVANSISSNGTVLQLRVLSGFFTDTVVRA